MLGSIDGDRIDPILFERVTLQSTQGAIDFLKLITSVDISSSNSSSSTDLSPPTPNPAFAPPSQLQLQLQLHALYPPQSPLITPRNAGRWSLARHVDALCIAHGPPEVVAQIVARCVNTRSLAVWGWMENLPELWVRVAEEAHIGVGQNMGRGGDDDRCIFQPIRLQRLSVDVRSLWTRRVVSERPQFKSGTVNHMGVVPLPFRQTSRTILKTAVGGDAEEEEEDVEWSDEWSISSKGEIEVIDGEEGRIFDEMVGFLTYLRVWKTYGIYRTGSKVHPNKVTRLRLRLPNHQAIPLLTLMVILGMELMKPAR